MKNNQTELKLEAEKRIKQYQDLLNQSGLTIVHDIVGESSPDVLETSKEKRRLAKQLAQGEAHKELSNTSWFFRPKRVDRLIEIIDAIDNA